MKFKTSIQEKIYQYMLEKLDGDLGERLINHPRTTGKMPYLGTPLNEFAWRGIHHDKVKVPSHILDKSSPTYAAYCAGKAWSKAKETV